jgi:hypothetical protein
VAMPPASDIGRSKWRLSPSIAPKEKARRSAPFRGGRC